MGNQVVFITGGADGIGLGIAKRFAQEGAYIVLCDKNEKKLFVAADSLQSGGIKSMPIKWNVTREDQLKAAIDSASINYGRIDVLINNAGL